MAQLENILLQTLVLGSIPGAVEGKGQQPQTQQLKNLKSDRKG
jgi:hypothetical protein